MFTVRAFTVLIYSIILHVLTLKRYTMFTVQAFAIATLLLLCSRYKRFHRLFMYYVHGTSVYHRQFVYYVHSTNVYRPHFITACSVHVSNTKRQREQSGNVKIRRAAASSASLVIAL